jgi:hypothetical protein
VNQDKDYYRILGVLDDAEDVVIRAAYRALAQRYHPDKWQGDAAEATRRMVEINAAYAVLSDTVKRAAYDATRDKNQFQDEPPEAEDANEAINKDWELAVKYLPALKLVEKDLHALSRELAFTFRLMLLETKRFDESVAVAKELEHGYLTKYFGDQAEVQAFAKELILEGRKDAAKELNEAVRVLGRVAPSVVDRIARDFQTLRFKDAGDVSSKYVPVPKEVMNELGRAVTAIQFANDNGMSEEKLGRLIKVGLLRSMLHRGVLFVQIGNSYGSRGW